jgi:hypothetical protein
MINTTKKQIGSLLISLFFALTGSVFAEDYEIRQFAIKEYPNDPSMQKFKYDQQVRGKSYMESVSDYQIKEHAIKEYPNDYNMQKFKYDQITSFR